MIFHSIEMDDGIAPAASSEYDDEHHVKTKSKLQRKQK